VQDAAQRDPAGAPPGKRRRATLDEHSRVLLKRFMADWVWPRWREITVALVLTALLAAATGSYPIIIKQSFDTLMKGNAATLPYVLAAVVGATATRSLFLYLQTTAMARIVLRMATDIQKACFAHLIEADYASLARETPGRHVSRLTNDIALISQAVQASLATAVRDVLMIVALVASMLYLDWMMTLVVLGIYPLAGLPIAVISSRLRSVAKRTQHHLGDMTSLLTERLSSTRLIKTFRLEHHAVSTLNKSFEEVLRLRLKAVSNRARLESILEALGGVAVAGVLLLAYWRIVGGESTVGDFMGFVTALLMAAQPIRALGTLYGKIQEGLAGTENIYALLDEKATVVDRPGARPLSIANGTIRFENVGFSYETATGGRAVHGFDLVAPGGKTVALVGRSGAGKSTIINLVPRLFDVAEGRISIDGQDVRDVTIESLRNAISMVSQDVTLFDGSIRDNIRLGRLGASDQEIEVAARAAAAHEFILAQPSGYDTQIGDQGQRLSGGQRQRLALARAILKNAPILLLDEATSALDTESERLVQDALARFTVGRTTLVIAHRLSTVHSADLICVMESGTIADLGTHQELLAKNGTYARLYRSQLMDDGSTEPGEPASST